MDILMSNWKNVKSVPKSFVFPPERRPGNNPVPMSKDIPVIDLGNFGNHEVETIQQILQASQEYGIFQVNLVSVLTKSSIYSISVWCLVFD